MAKMTGGRFFAEALQAYDITHLFFVPTILTPALAELDRKKITAVMTHGEKAAAYMADSYARISHRPGICMAQTVGAANLAAGLRDAYLACSPVVAITGGRLPESKYRHVYQEIEDYPLFQPLTKLSLQLDLVERLPDLIRMAFRVATTGCPRPVHLEIAGNMGQIIDKEAELDPIFEKPFRRYPAYRPTADSQALDKALDALSRSEKPVIVAGGGVARSQAEREVVRLAERWNLPVATSLNGKGTILENHPLSIGVVGLYSRACANQIVSEADLVFFIGSHTGSQVTYNWQVPGPKTRVIQLDIEAAELGRNYPHTVSLCGDAKAVIQQLLEVNRAPAHNRIWLERTRHLVNRWRSEFESFRRSNAIPMRPERICAEVQAALPENAILVSDTGHAGIWSAAHIEIRHPGQSFLRAAGSLGWGLPAALGAKCAQSTRSVVCFTGDGGFYYHVAELETAVRYGLNVVIVVNNNHSLNQETDIFNTAYGGKQESGFHMWQFERVNFARVAEGFGCLGLRVERPDEMAPALDRALHSGRPTVIDAVSDIQALPPDPWSG